MLVLLGAIAVRCLYGSCGKLKDLHGSYYSGMGPGMLSRIYAPEEIRFATRQVVEKQGGIFVRAKATEIQPQKRKIRLDNGREISYDVLSCNVGSAVPEVPGQEAASCFPVKPIASLLQAQHSVLECSARVKIRLGVVGGGPAALEVAGNLHRLVHDAGGSQARITVFAGRTFLFGLHERIRKRAEKNFFRRGIELIVGGYVRRLDQNLVELDSGWSFACDVTFLALGVRPSSLFVESGLQKGPDGGLLVNEYLQSPDYPEIFGGGDCIFLAKQPLGKVGVYAVRENPVLYHNLEASLNKTQLRTFDPGGDYLLIYNLGDGTGILHKGKVTFGGRPAFWIKDWIDRKFMKRFQALE
jgi:NADH dehydrogenase FAD-containing subunit